MNKKKIEEGTEKLAELKVKLDSMLDDIDEILGEKEGDVEDGE